MLSSLFRTKKEKDNKFTVKRKNPYTKWRKVKRLGKGAFAVVDLYSHGDKLIAIKKFDRAKPFIDEEFNLERNGFRAAGDHRHLVTYLDAFSLEHAHNIVLEYCREGPLSKIHKSYPNYDEKDIRDVVIQCSSALEHMRQRGVIHRDIKPENILVKKWSPMEVVLADFNFSITVKKAEHTTVMKTKLGTKGYKAPEIEETEYRNSKKKYSFKVDVFSLGMVAYELISEGTKPSYKLSSSTVDKVNYQLKGNRPAILKRLREEKKKYYEKMTEQGVPLLPKEKWSSVSSEAKDLISHMIVPLYESRPSYEQILESDWGTMSYPQSLV